MNKTYILIIKRDDFDFKEILGIPLLYYHFLRARNQNSSLFLVTDDQKYIDFFNNCKLEKEISDNCYITLSNCFEKDVKFNLTKKEALKIIESKEIKEKDFIIRTNKDFYSFRNIVKEYINFKFIEKGVDIENISTTYIGPEVNIEKGTKITGDTHIYGKSCIGKNNLISSSYIENTNIKDDNKILNSHIVGAMIGCKNEIGPFCRMRGKAVIDNECVLGNFVEIKSSNIKDHVKIKHLSYIGDTFIEKNVNIGCGFVTANYDGKRKYPTTIEENVFVGCNTTIVSPVTLKENCFIAAGSVITKDVEKNDLAIARSRQINKTNYVKQKK